MSMDIHDDSDNAPIDLFAPRVSQEGYAFPVEHFIPAMKQEPLDEPASLEDRDNIRNYTLAVKEALPRMQPVTLNDKPVYGWVILPAPYKPSSHAGSATSTVAFQPTSDKACRSNPLLKQQEKMPPPRSNPSKSH